MTTTPKTVPDSALAPMIAEELRAASYDEASVRAHLSRGEEAIQFGPETLPRMLRATDGGSPLETFLRLFSFSVPVPRDRFEAASQSLSVDDWVRAGVVRLEGDEVVPTVCLSPQANLLLAFDLIRPGEARAEDFVMGLARSSLLILNSAIPVTGSVLELGTGCGGVAIALSRRAERVVATDISERAVHFARFNVALNGVTNVELRHGSLMEPVAGEQFDQIVMNAPYVISPDARFTYRDGGETFVRQMIAAAAPALKPGGVLQTTAQWPHIGEEGASHRLRTWLEPLGLQAWVIRTASRTVATYTENWISETEIHEPASYRARFEQWLGWFEQQNITGISTGVITLREPGGEGSWFDMTHDDVELDADAGDAIADGLAGRRLLHRCADDPGRLLDAVFEVVHGVRLEQELTTAGDGWTADAVRLRTTRGIRGGVNVDQRVAALVGRCNGRRSLGQLVAEMAATLGRDPSALAPALVAVARLLIEKGVLRQTGVGTEPV